MPKQPIPNKKDLAQPPKHAFCQEAAIGVPGYVPCGKPAVYVVQGSDVDAYTMCDMCADHNVNNRGFRYLLKSDQYHIHELAPSHADQRNAITAAEVIDDVEEAPEASDAQLKKVAHLVQAQLDLQAEIASLEATLAIKNAALKTNVEADLPAAMSECGIKTEDKIVIRGATVELKKLVAASIPEAHKTAGIAWMEENAPDLVKHTITIEFGLHDAKFFAKFQRDLAQRKKPVKSTQRDTVLPQSLGKFVRERDAAGLGVPEQILGVYRRTVAVVKPPKASQDEIG